MKLRSAVVVSCLGMLATATGAAAQERLVTGSIDESQTVTLTGNTRPEAIWKNDRGRVGDNLALQHLQLLLNRSPTSEAALEARIEALTNPLSSSYHQWLTAAQFGAEYGPSSEDVECRHRLAAEPRLYGERRSHRPHDRRFLRHRRTGSRSVRHRDTHTGCRRRLAHRQHERSKIPAALSNVVRGIVSLNDFRPHTNFKQRPAYTFTSGGSTYHAVVPADLATIYNLNPLFSAGISGQGQTIVVIEDTNVYSTADWTKFRSTFGLSGYTGATFTQVHPTGSGGACSNPGVLSGNEGEAELDAEWASAAAPSAKIELASCSDTSTTFGGLIALQNLINGSSPPPIVSISYGECEAENGATANAAYNSTYQQAAALGVSVFVSSGDEGAASCDANLTKATHGIAVSGFASTPYNVAVGGTDFGDTYAGTTATYWNATNTSVYGSAKSYIPEIPWNDSCASVLLATAAGYSTTYGTSGFCNSSTGKANYLTTASGSGGPSGCATGKASTTGVVSGTCKGYAKPSWQSLVGVPADGVRDIPDVSLFAANGVWGHYYVYCDSDTNDGESCSGAPSAWSGAGGTSFAAPIMAAIQSLVNQKQGAKQGNPNPTYYKLAATEYGSGGSSICNSSKGNAASASCIFYDTTLGDMDVDCTGTHNCYKPSGTYGVLSTSTSSYAKAYGTTTGWDFATGIGSLNAANLVNNW